MMRYLSLGKEEKSVLTFLLENETEVLSQAYGKSKDKKFYACWKKVRKLAKRSKFNMISEYDDISLLRTIIEHYKKYCHQMMFLSKNGKRRKKI